MNSFKNINSRQTVEWKQKIQNAFLLFLLIIVFVSGSINAQDLINSGSINNSGTFRVKNSVIGLHGRIGGLIDYYGSNQIVPAIQYNDLSVTGEGIKQTSGGDFLVDSNLLVDSTTTLQIEPGFILSLGGILTEKGYLSGSIRKDVELSGITISSDFGNIGAIISWSSTAPGSTSVTRTSGIAQTGNGNQSTLRYYDIIPNITSGTQSKLILKYSNNELNGHNPYKLLLWKSLDSGKTWKVQGGITDPSSRLITKQGAVLLGRWTFADSLHPLGSLKQIIGVLAVNSGNNQSQEINTVLQPFVASVTDSEGNILAGESVLFRIAEFPSGASGQFLSETTVLSDTNGIARTTLTLGNKVGRYTVTVSFADNSSNPIMFTASAYAGTAVNLLSSAGDHQSQDIGTTLANPLSVTVTDAGGNAVQGATVLFTITNAPAFSQGHILISPSVTSDSLGQASTLFKLGNKFGTYTVNATVQGLSGVSTFFNATATAFLADANGDKRVNVADLTTVIDKVLDNIELTPENLTRADVDTNNVIDVRDAVIILDGLLKGNWDSSTVSMKQVVTASDVYSGEFEITPQGLRFNLFNKTPVKGIQITLRFKKQMNISKPDFVYNRGKHMQLPIQQQDNVMHIVLYNNENIAIDSGRGSIFRLPLSKLALEDFEILSVIVSTPGNEGINIFAQKDVAAANKYPEAFALDQNYPNPFNNSTNIGFKVPDYLDKTANILLQIYDLAGRKVKTLVEGEFEPGTYTYIWNGTKDDGGQVSSGTYLYRIRMYNSVSVRKMMLIK